MNRARIEAMVNQCRRLGGGHNALKVQDAIDKKLASISLEIQDLKRKVKHLEMLREKSVTPPVKLLVELSPPDGYKPMVVNDSGDCHCFYHNEETMDDIEIDWPFDRESVFTEDLEKLGFEVVVA